MPSVKNAEREVDTASDDITTGYNSIYAIHKALVELQFHILFSEEPKNL